MVQSDLDGPCQSMTGASVTLSMAPLPTTLVHNRRLASPHVVIWTTLAPMGRFSFLEWPVVRQLRTSDTTARSSATVSEHTRQITSRNATADHVVSSVCPYCAVGCGQKVYVKDNKVIQIEGDPDSPISRGRLCPKGAASEQLVNAPGRQYHVLYRAPKAKDWQRLELSKAVDMVADRFIETRRRTWQDADDQGRKLNRTMGIASLGGATLDNEENYLIKKLFTAAGAIQIENQARI